MRPQPSIECGNDQSVSSRPKAVPDAVDETGQARHDESATRERDRSRHREREERKDERVAEPAELHSAALSVADEQKVVPGVYAHGV